MISKANMEAGGGIALYTTTNPSHYALLIDYALMYFAKPKHMRYQSAAVVAAACINDTQYCTRAREHDGERWTR